MSADADIEEIRAIVQRQFDSLSWSKVKQPGWQAFANDFVAGAPLYSAARPVRGQTVDAFVDRMRTLSESTLTSLDEQLLGLNVQVFGNVAVAMATCQLNENESETSRNVEAILLVRSDGRWQIAAQAWDTETAEKPVPAALLSLPQTPQQRDT
ncbi:MAG: hypothetical protein JXQ99_27660 [Hyphomicrobiaceae bacterium]